MSNGLFFKVDKNSEIDNGLLVFRYLMVRTEELTFDDSTDYPVYLTMHSSGIDVYFHSCHSIVTDSRKEKSGHKHLKILHLPLSKNLAVKDNLTEKLNYFYDKTFDFKHYKLLDKNNFISYSSLDCFKENYSPSNFKKNKILLREIILDFLFDMEHSDVFAASPFFEEVEVRLRENFLFSAISSKAAYFYERELFWGNIGDAEVSEIYAKKMAEAEKQWLNIIRNSGSVQLFKTKKWFDIVEKEYNEVLFSKKFSRSVWRAKLEEKNKGEKYAEENRNILHESARWFLRRYNFTKGMKAIFQYYPERKLPIFFLAIFTFLIFPLCLYDINLSTTSLSADKEIISFILYMCLGIIPFVIGVALLLYKMFLPLLSAMLPRLMMAIASSWLFFATTEELVKSSFDVRILDIDKIWVFLLVIPVVAFMAVEINNMAPDISAKTLIKRMFALVGIGFIYSILIGLFFINSLTESMLERSDYLDDFYRTEINVYGGNENLRFFYDGELPISYSNKEYRELRICNSNKEYYQNLANTKYKEILGFDTNSSFALKYDVRISDKLSFLNDFQIFPGMLIYRAIFSLFIGIFIQLIFEDKPITEPL